MGYLFTPAFILAAIPILGFAADAQQDATSRKLEASLSAAIKARTPLAATMQSIGQARSEAQLAELKSLGVDVAEINRPWNIFLRSLSDRFQLDSKHVQVATSPQPADWSDATYGEYRRSFYGDAIPSWGATFNPQTSSSFAEEYGNFISAIQLTKLNPSDLKMANDARDKWNNCASALQNHQKLVGKHWTDFNSAQQGIPPARQLQFDVWYKKFEAPTLRTFEQQCQALAIDYNLYFSQATSGQGSFQNAINRYSSFTQVSALIPGTKDQYDSVWPYTFVQDLDKFVADSDSAPGLAFDQTFDKTSGTYDATSSSWGGSASYGWFFHASAGGSSSTVDTHSDEFKMQIQMKGLQSFDVKPQSWYSQALIQTFGTGPFVANSPIKREYEAGTLYGEGGVFSLRVSRYIVAYQPKIVLAMSSANYHETKSAWSGGGGFGIGPFSFGASGGGSSTHTSWDDAHNTLTIENTSKTPQIIAVIVEVLPNFK